MTLDEIIDRNQEETFDTEVERIRSQLGRVLGIEFPLIPGRCVAEEVRLRAAVTDDWW